MGWLIRAFFKWSVTLALLLFLLGAIPDTMQDAMRAYQAGDCAKAARLFGILAERGDAKARYWLGKLFVDGTCARGREADGLKLIETAAEQGLAVAQTELGVRYMLGDGLPQDRDAGLEWLARARDNPAGAYGFPVIDPGLGAGAGSLGINGGGAGFGLGGGGGAGIGGGATPLGSGGTAGLPPGADPCGNI